MTLIDVDGETVLDSFTMTSDTEGTFNPTEFDSFDVPVLAGHTVEVTDGTSTKNHVVAPLVVTSVDEMWEVVSGTTDPLTDVYGWIHQEGSPNIDATSDGAGDWAIDFTGSWDLVLGTQGAVAQQDNDGDQTQVDWVVTDPYFVVDAGADDVWGSDWVRNGDVVVTLFESDHSTVKWSEPVSTDDGGAFGVTIGNFDVDVMAGDWIEVYDDPLVKELHVQGFTATGDHVADSVTVTGMFSGAPVTVAIHDDPAPIRVGNADGSGVFVADFTEAGSLPQEQVIYNVLSDTSGDAVHIDTDGDQEIAFFPPPMPANHIAVDPQHEQVVGWQWGAGNQVTVQIDDDADFSSLLYTKVNVGRVRRR